MTNLLAYTTITITTADGTEVQIWAEAEKSSLNPGESTNIKVFTSPTSYLSAVQGVATEGSLSKIGISTYDQKDEDVELTKPNDDSLATGSLKYDPSSSVAITPISVIGSYSSVSVNGKELTATSQATYAAVVKCDYSYKAMVFKYTAPINNKADKVICMWSLNV